MSILLKLFKNRRFLTQKKNIFRIKPLFKSLGYFGLIGFLIILGLLLFFDLKNKVKADDENIINQEIDQELKESLILIENNSLLNLSDHFSPEPKVKKQFLMVITGYSSNIWETDDDPFITASGKAVRKGIVANNILPFGTRIKIPEVFGDQIFVVEDRMSALKNGYYLDIWFPSYQEALNFGFKIAQVQILEN